MERKTLTLKNSGAKKPEQAQSSNKPTAEQKDQYALEWRFISALVGKRVVAQMNRGEIYKGILQEVNRPWLTLNTATINGSRHMAEVENVFIRVDPKAVRHIHEDTAVVTKKDMESKHD